MFGTFGTLFLRNFELVRFGGENFLLAGTVLLSFISLLVLQGIKEVIEGRLRIGIWEVSIIGFFTILIGAGFLKYGRSNTLADVRYLVWVVWGYSIFRIINERGKSLNAQMVVIYFSGILTIGYALFSVTTGYAAKKLSTGGMRYIEEDAMSYMAVVFFLLLTRLIGQRRVGFTGGIGFCITVVMALLSAKRSVWMGLAGGTTALLLINQVGFKKILILGLLFGFGAVSFFSLTPEGRRILVNRVQVFSEGNITDPSIFFRFAAWAKVAEAGVKNPILPGGIGSDFDFEFKSIGLHLKYNNVSPHNTVLWVFYKTGIVGLILYLRLIFLSVRRSWLLARIYRDRKDAAGFENTSVLLAFVLYETIASMFWDYFAIASMAIIYWWVLAAINGLWHSEFGRNFETARVE